MKQVVDDVDRTRSVSMIRKNAVDMTLLLVAVLGGQRRRSLNNEIVLQQTVLLGHNWCCYCIVLWGSQIAVLHCYQHLIEARQN